MLQRLVRLWRRDAHEPAQPQAWQSRHDFGECRYLGDLDAMVGIREAFDGLKKILVVADSTGGDDRKYHLLEPRYITQAGRNIAELEAVIHKMAGFIQ